MKRFLYTIISFMAVLPMMAQDCTTATATITFYRNGGSPTPPTPVYDDYYFSVSSSKKVVFAHGNVHYNGSDYTFLSNQYSYYRNTSDVSRDLFDYKADWASESVNGDEAGKWNNLTKSEWEYLWSRSENNHLMWTHAKVNGTYGLVLFPDGWNDTTGYITDYGFSYGDDSKHNFTVAQWDALEAIGAVFLPGAGNYTCCDNNCAMYMSLTQTGGNYYLMCSCKDFAPKWEGGDSGVALNFGAAVRPVRNAVLPVYEPHYFSVAADKKVMFAHGNIHYDGSAYTFLSNQYTYGRNQSADNRDLYDFKTDWVSEIINGDEAGKWNNLTKTEWEYLWSRRVDDHLMWTHAKVNGTYGLILLPDDWNNTSGVTVVYGHNYGDEGVNSYTVADWEALEAIGAIFLPGAGNYTCCDNNCAMYMSLTPTGGNYYLMCSCKDFAPKWEGEGGSVVTSFGAAVRLVRAAEIVTP